MRDSNASCAVVVTSLKNVNGFQPNQARKSWNSCEIESCVKTVCLKHILLLIARVLVRVVMISALFPENTWAHFTMPCWPAFAEDKKKIAIKDLVLGQAQTLRSPKVITWLWRVVFLSLVVAMSTRPCRSYLLKSKEGAAARLLQHMPCSIKAQHRPGAVRVWPRG